jgi:hypothetical protein
MAFIAGNQVIGSGRVSTFHEDVVGGIAGDLGQARWHNRVRLILDDLDQLLTEGPPNPEFGPCQDYRVFGQNSIRDVPPGWLSLAIQRSAEDPSA